MDSCNKASVKDNTDDIEDDDFFGDDDDNDAENTGEFGSLGHYEARAKQEELKTIGYLESYDEAKELLLQQGFESGYRETFTVSKSLGEQFGKLVTEMEFLGNQPEENVTTATEVSKRLHEFLTTFQNRPTDSQFNGKDSIELLQQELFCSQSKKNE